MDSSQVAKAIDWLSRTRVNLRCFQEPSIVGLARIVKNSCDVEEVEHFLWETRMLVALLNDG